MNSMNSFLPVALRSSVDEQLPRRNDDTGSECARELIHKDQGRSQLRALFLQAAATSITAEMKPDYFAKLRARIR